MNIVEKIESVILGDGGRDYLGEAVSMREHFLQCAEQVAANEGDDALVAAALLHDIGHFGQFFDIDLDRVDVDNQHGELGARILEPHFHHSVVEPVRLHVQAKRYLCATDKDYFGHLSEASVLSLTKQGGPMSAKEAAQFAQHPSLDAALTVRRADDNAKVVGAVTRSFDDFTPLLQRLVIN